VGSRFSYSKKYVMKEVVRTRPPSFSGISKVLFARGRNKKFAPPINKIISSPFI